MTTSLTELKPVAAAGIYSFPKSGNTWVRHIIGSLLQLDKGGSADTLSAVPDLYEIKGKPLPIQNTPRLGSIAFYKSHASREITTFNGTLLQNNLIVYIIRNPLDVFLSQLNYLCKGFGGKSLSIVEGRTVDQCKDDGTIDDLFSSFLMFGTLTPHFRDAGSWFLQVNDWIDRASKREEIHILKYEDLLAKPLDAFAPILDQLGYTREQLVVAMGIAETKCNDGGRFFWSKRSANFTKYMTRFHAKKLLIYHHNTVEKLGYCRFINDAFDEV